VIIDATYEVTPAVITGVSTTIVSFLPVFFLTGRDLKLFGPLAWTKTFAMVAHFGRGIPGTGSLSTAPAQLPLAILAR
jgi:Cu/Ag efflux pump CusA